jgi:hypothetical protein
MQLFFVSIFCGSWAVLLLCRLPPSPYKKGKTVFSLYVVVAVFNFPQDCDWGRLRFRFATFFGV